jgi:transcriptional regulator with XRE-family HTH domain
MYSLTNSPSRESIEDYDANVDYQGRMELNARIHKARIDARMTQDQLADAVGKTRGAVSQWESGEVRPRHSTLKAIANATGKPLTWLESGIGKDATGLMVVGEVAGGVWLEGSVEYIPRGVPVAPHPDYAPEAQRLYQVRGTSINKRIADGEYAHCVNLKSGAITLLNGDLVIVCRSNHGLVEYTAKRYVVEDGKKILRPESDDPAWQEDIVIAGDGGIQIEIIDVVIAKWSPLRRGF